MSQFRLHSLHNNQYLSYGEIGKTKNDQFPHFVQIFRLFCGFALVMNKDFLIFFSLAQTIFTQNTNPKDNEKFFLSGTKNT